MIGLRRRRQSPALREAEDKLHLHESSCLICKRARDRATVHCLVGLELLRAVRRVQRQEQRQTGR